MPITSLPACGSESPNPARCSPVATRPHVLLLLRLAPGDQHRPGREPREQQHQRRGVGVLRDLFDRDGEAEDPGAGPAVLLRDHQAEQPGVTEQVEEILRVRRRGVDLAGPGRDLLLRDLADGGLELQVLRREVERHRSASLPAPVAETGRLGTPNWSIYPYPVGRMSRDHVPGGSGRNVDDDGWAWRPRPERARSRARRRRRHRRHSGCAGGHFPRTHAAFLVGAIVLVLVAAGITIGLVNRGDGSASPRLRSVAKRAPSPTTKPIPKRVVVAMCGTVRTRLGRSLLPVSSATTRFGIGFVVGEGARLATLRSRGEAEPSPRLTNPIVLALVAAGITIGLVNRGDGSASPRLRSVAKRAPSPTTKPIPKRVVAKRPAKTRPSRVRPFRTLRRRLR